MAKWSHSVTESGEKMMAKKKGMPLGTFMKLFSTKAQCEEYLAALRWGAGYVCPKCGSHHGYRLSNGRYQCAECRHQTSVTAGTVLHKTHMPLTQWFLAFYFMSQDKRGISAGQQHLLIFIQFQWRRTEFLYSGFITLKRKIWFCHHNSSGFDSI